MSRPNPETLDRNFDREARKAGLTDEQTAYAREALPHYIACALWSSVVGERGTPADELAEPEDLTVESHARMSADLCGFVGLAWANLTAANLEPESCGHDFWLDRNGHGAGFWDRDLGDVGERLSEQAHTFGESYLDVENGRVYVN